MDKLQLTQWYNEACREKDPFIRKLKLAFCLVMAEDGKLMEALASQ